MIGCEAQEGVNYTLKVHINASYKYNSTISDLQ